MRMEEITQVEVLPVSPQLAPHLEAQLLQVYSPEAMAFLEVCLATTTTM